MNIKVGDYVETKDGRIGFVKTVKNVETAEMKRVEVCFDFEITQPPVKSGVRGFFSGVESDVWRKFNRIGFYTDPFRELREKRSRDKIEPIEFGKIEKVRATKVPISTDGDVKTERGEFDTLKRTQLTVTDLAVKINEIINYLNTEGR